jgi:hypothetical protein
MTKTTEWLTVVFTGIIAITGVWALIYASGQIRLARDEAQVQHLLTLENQYKAEPLAGVEEPDEVHHSASSSG